LSHPAVRNRCLFWSAIASGMTPIDAFQAAEIILETLHDMVDLGRS
jgi:hypothetical protein